MEFVFDIYSVIAVVLVVYFPVHLIIFSIRKWQAWKAKSSAGPSFLTLLFYLLVLYSCWRSVDFFLKFNVRSAHGEAITNLGAIFVTQVAYYGENLTYAGGPKAFDQLGWVPEGEARYAYFCGDDVIPRGRAKALGLELGGNWPLKVRPQTTRDSFTCLAVGNIDYDQVLDVWSFSDNKERRNLFNDLGYATQRDLEEIYINPPKLTFLERAVMGFWWVKDEFDDRFRIGFAAIALFGPWLLIWLILREAKRWWKSAPRDGQSPT
jgi:hypothetical protein